MTATLRLIYNEGWETEFTAETGAFVAVGQQIAAETNLSRRMQHFPERYGDITVERTPNGATVAAHGRFAHLEEWGSANSPPYASMRRAAERFGRFKEQ